MNFKIELVEANIIREFRKLRYPAIYKIDNTDNILFVEMVDFDVCSFLLNGVTIDVSQYNEIIAQYHRFLRQIDIHSFDGYALEHYQLLNQIMKIFIKYYDR